MDNLSAQGVAVAESASGPWRRLGLVAAGGLGWGASGKGGGFRTNLWNGLRVDSGRALVVNGTKLYSTKGIGNGTKIPNENPGGHYQALQGVFFPKSNQSWAPPYTAYSRNPVTRAGPDGNTFTVGGAENCEFYSGPDGFFHATCAAHGALYPGGDCPHYLVSVSSEMDVQWTFVGFHCSGAAEATPVYEGAPPGDKARVNFFIARDKGGVSLYSVSWAPVNQSSGGRQIKTDDVDVSAVPTDDDARYIFFIKAPTSPAFRNVTWLQQHPQDFSEGSFRTFIDALGGHSANPKMKVGLTFQWELLDCFLSPHSCTAAQTAQGVTAFLDAAAATNTPVQITLDTVQFWYQSGLWNWWDPAQPGYDPKNVANVEWTGWSSTNATLIAWRNWGSQFRMPTPQPNLASPALLQRTGAALTSAIGAIRRWYEAATPAARKLLVGVKLGEEVDVGVNYYYYQHGNQLYKSNPHNASADPTAGPDWSKGLAGGLQAQGYNMLKTLGLRSSGGPPTRGEITQGVRHYFKSIVGACVAAWPALARNGLLATHGGACSDPLRIEWNSPMIAPATPGYSFYLSPSCFHKKSCFQPGLKTALDNYNGNSKKGRFVVAETACFGCKSVAEWEGYFHTIFANNKVGEVQYLRYYNIEPFLAAAGSVEGLQNFMKGWRKEESIPKQSTKSNDFDWIHQIVNGPPGQKYTLDAKTYLIDKQYQLPRGTELRGVGTALDHRTEIKAVGQPYNACAGTASAPGLHQGRKGLLLGDDTYVSGLHLRGMETKRLDCLYAMIETPGCQNSEGNFPSPPNETGPCGPAGRNLNCCGGYTGNDGHGVSNATVEDVTVEGYTTQNMFFMAPTAASKRVSRDITVRNMRMNGSWADGVNIHGQHLNVMIEGCTVIDSGDDNFAMWSIAAGQNNVTFKNCTAIRGTEKTKPDPHGAAGINCCFVNFGGLAFSFIDNHGEGCGLTPRRGIGHGAEALVVLGCPNKGNPAFGGAWNKSSSVIVHGMTGSCAGQDGCPLCKFQPVYAYPLGFPGSVQNSACNISYGSATRFGSRLTLKLDDEPPAPSSSSYNSIGKTPIRGYQSWNDLGAKVSEALLRERADALVSTGLAALGYKYVCIDDIWAESSRDPITHELVPDKTRFPNGMKVVSEYMHSKGLLFGLYVALGNHTCSHKMPGSYGHIALDAKTLTGWDVDLLKVDTCIDKTSDHPLGDNDLDVTLPAFMQFSRLLNASGIARGKPIYFSMCSGTTFPFNVARYFANSWRMGMDTYIFSNFLDSLQSVSYLQPFSGNGGWNDLDMLGAKSYNSNQSRSQFSLNALLGSPLLLSMDVSSLSPYDFETYSNVEVLNISSDPLALPGVQIGGGSVSGVGNHGDCSACYDGVQLAACSGGAANDTTILHFDSTSGTISAPGLNLDLGPNGGNPLACYAEAVLNPPRSSNCCGSIADTSTPHDATENVMAPNTRRNVTCTANLGVSYDGGDIRSFTNATAESCCAACQSESSCTLWEICHPQAGRKDCDDMRCWLKNSHARLGRSMNDRMSMRVPGKKPPPPAPPAGLVCASQRWKIVPTPEDDGSVLLSNVLTSHGTPLCLTVLGSRAIGLLGVASCNASDAQQLWTVDAGSSGVLTKAEPERRCVSAPSARASTGTTIWGKQLTDGFVVVFLNQNSGGTSITCGADCMKKLVGDDGRVVTKLHARDVWAHVDLPEMVDVAKGFSVMVGGGGGASVAMIKLTIASTAQSQA